MGFLQQKKEEKKNLAIHFSFGIFLVLFFLVEKNIKSASFKNIYRSIFIFSHKNGRREFDFTEKDLIEIFCKLEPQSKINFKSHTFWILCKK